MAHDTDFTALFTEHCTTAAAFNRILSTLLSVAHSNDIDVGGAWEASDGDMSPEWDVVVTPLAQDETGASADGDVADGDEQTD